MFLGTKFDVSDKLPHCTLERWSSALRTGLKTTALEHDSCQNFSFYFVWSGGGLKMFVTSSRYSDTPHLDRR